jgi:hypothetical protein
MRAMMLALAIPMVIPTVAVAGETPGPGVYQCHTNRFGQTPHVRNVTLKEDGTYDHWAVSADYGESGSGTVTFGEDGRPEFTSGPLVGAEVGEIEVRDGPPKGWVFKVTLPTDFNTVGCGGPLYNN